MNLEQEAEQFMKEKYNMVEFNVYQTTASDTAIYEEQYKILYPALGLAGEAGEIANKVKKLIRDGPAKRPTDWRQQISDELGDVLWYCAALATDLNLTLGAIAGENLNKLSARKEAGTIGGSGDKR